MDFQIIPELPMAKKLCGKNNHHLTLRLSGVGTTTHMNIQFANQNMVI